MCSDFSVSFCGTPPSTTNSSESAWPRPMCRPPSIWPSTSVGLIARPTSWAAITFSSRPSSSRITTCVAHAYARCVTGSSASFAVVQSTVNSPRNSRPASASTEPPSSACFSFRAASITALPPSTVEREAVVWPGLEVVLGVDGDPDPLGRQVELLAGDLPEDGVHALAHLRPGVEERDRPVRLRPQDRATVLGDAVADPGVLHAAGDAGVARVAVGVLDREQRLLQADAGPEQLAGAEAVAGARARCASGSPSRRSRPARRAGRGRPRWRSWTG